MKRSIRNNQELNNILGNIARKALNNVSEKIIDLLIEYIQRDTYDAAENESPRTMYQPTYDFRDKAFRFKNTRKMVNHFVKELFYDWQAMQLDPENYIHSQGGDFRKKMASAFNVDGFVEGDFISRKRKPFWDDFMRKCFDEGYIYELFKEELGKYGFFELK